MDQKERTKINDQKNKDLGLIRIHPWVPDGKQGEVFSLCKKLRDEHQACKDKYDKEKQMENSEFKNLSEDELVLADHCFDVGDFRGVEYYRALSKERELKLAQLEESGDEGL